jgi:uncharacterized membrane protein YvlD (DUF360 family)
MTVAAPREDAGRSIVRSERLRPRLRQIIGRGIAVVVTNALALVVLEPLLDGLDMNGLGAAMRAGLVIGILNALVWPTMAFLVVPISTLTLGLGAIILDALAVGLLLDLIPGVDLDGFWTAVVVTIGLTVVTTVVGGLLAIDDDVWFDEYMARRARRRRDRATTTDVPGVVFVQIDGLAEQVLERALASGDAPTLHRWLHEGSHRLVGWETDWSSQTGVSQCGILHGSNDEMPAFRWLEKDTGTVVVSNHPSSAAEIERRHSDGNGLLAHHGSSYGNLFTGDAERAVLTMSVAGRVKEGRIGAGYVRYFSRPGNAARSLTGAVVDIARERRAARDQHRRGVEPRVHRGFTYSFLRAFTTVISRDVCVNGILGDIAEGRSAIYVDLLGFDEVAHHSGPERADSLAVLRDIDRQIGRIQRCFRWAPRPYHIVVLSDHGQTQGPAFAEEFGETLEQVVGRLTGTAPDRDPDSAAGRTESSAWLRTARNDDEHLPEVDRATPTVLGSGSLGLIYLPGPPRRLVLEEIDERYPGLVDGLRAHPGIGFVLVRSAERGPLVLGTTGERQLGSAADVLDVLIGDDPLAPYGSTAAAKVARVDGYRHVADLMVNATYDPVTDEVHAFEHQVGSHGGLGGPQTRPFILYPASLSQPAGPIVGAEQVYRQLKHWLDELGHPLTPRPTPGA